MTRLIRAAAATLACSLAYAADPATLQRDLEAMLQAEKLAGAVWAVVTPAGVATGAAGSRHLPTAAPLRTTDKVHVGSVTKTMLALGVLRLATLGRIDLEAPLTRYLPDLPLRNPWPTDPVTLRHLLDHTAGLEDARFWQIFSRQFTPDTPLAEAWRRQPAVLQVRTRPGSVFSYSNLGYTLLGAVLEAATGERYEPLLDRELLRPLGLTQSTFAFTRQDGPRGDSALAWGHLDDGQPVAALPMVVRPAGQFTTTADDMTRIVRFLLGQDVGVGADFIRPEWRQQFGRPPATEARQHGLEHGYSLGLSWRDRHGVRGLAHAGSIVGYHAMLYVFPEVQAGCFIAHNSDREGADYERFNARLLREIGVASAVPPPPSEQYRDESWFGWYVPLTSRFQAFAYADLFSAWRVGAPAGRLVLTPVLDGAPRELEARAGARFRQVGRLHDSHVFYRDAAGRRLLTDGLSTRVAVSPWWLAAHGLASGLGLLGLATTLGGGLWQWLRRGRAFVRTPAFFALVPWAFLLAAAALLMQQDFARLGDPTLGSGLLALGTALLPLGLAGALLRRWRQGFPHRSARWEATLHACALGYCLLLANWGLLPFRLWG